MDTTASALARAGQTLATAKLGLRMLKTGAPDQRMAGLRNVVVFGRALTHVLQNLRATEPQFDEWYAPLRAEMEGDPLLRHLVEVRNAILKKGVVRTAVHMHIKQFHPSDMARFGPPPPGATGFVMGDALGGVGWQVPQPDGTTEMYYAELPGDIGSITVHFSGAPKEHLGVPLPDVSAERVAQLYVDYLQRLLDKAMERFGSGRR